MRKARKMRMARKVWKACDTRARTLKGVEDAEGAEDEDGAEGAEGV